MSDIKSLILTVLAVGFMSFALGLCLGVTAFKMPRADFLVTVKACRDSGLTYRPVVNTFGQLIRVSCGGRLMQ